MCLVRTRQPHALRKFISENLIKLGLSYIEFLAEDIHETCRCSWTMVFRNVSITNNKTWKNEEVDFSCVGFCSVKRQRRQFCWMSRKGRCRQHTSANDSVFVRMFIFMYLFFFSYICACLCFCRCDHQELASLYRMRKKLRETSTNSHEKNQDWWLTMTGIYTLFYPIFRNALPGSRKLDWYD